MARVPGAVEVGPVTPPRTCAHAVPRAQHLSELPARRATVPVTSARSAGSGRVGTAPEPLEAGDGSLGWCRRDVSAPHPRSALCAPTPSGRARRSLGSGQPPMVSASPTPPPRHLSMSALHRRPRIADGRSATRRRTAISSSTAPRSAKLPRQRSRSRQPAHRPPPPHSWPADPLRHLLPKAAERVVWISDARKAVVARPPFSRNDRPAQ